MLKFRQTRHRLTAAALGLLLTAPLLIVTGAGAQSSSTPGTAAAENPTPENLGTPTESYQVIDTVMGEDAAGRPILYGTTYNALTSEGAVFFGIDPVTGEKTTQKVMEGNWGAYHIAEAPDGRIYIGNQNGANLPVIWRYDPATDEVKWVATISGTRGFCFGLTVSPSGKVYCGIHGGGIHEYDPATGKQRLVSPSRAYPKALLMLDDTQMVVGQGTDASVAVLDVTTGLSWEALPAEYADIGYAYNITRVGDSVYVQLSAPGDTILRFSADTMEFIEEVPGLTGMSFAEIGSDEFVALGESDTQSGPAFVRVSDGEELELTQTGITGGWLSPVRYQPEAGTVDIDGDIWVTGIGNGNGLFGRWNPRTGEVWTRQIELPGAPADITAMTLGPDGQIYGGTYETQALFEFGPSTGQTTNLGVVTTQALGEILSMAVTEDRVFMGSYTDNIITVYDPTRPWNPGTAADSNPLDLGPVGEDQYRPYGMTVGSDGRVWVTSAAAYGQLGGALSAIDPITHEVESFRYLAGNQHLFSIAAGDGVLYLGTSTFGDNSNAGGYAELLVFDIATEEVVQSVPVTGTIRVDALATADDGTLYGAAEVGGAGYWFRYDPETGEPTWFGQFPYGPVRDLVLGPDGFIYGLTPSNVFRIQTDTAEVTPVATPGGGSTPIGGFYNTMTFDREGRLYWGSGPNLMRLDVTETQAQRELQDLQAAVEEHRPTLSADQEEYLDGKIDRLAGLLETAADAEPEGETFRTAVEDALFVVQQVDRWVDAQVADGLMPPVVAEDLRPPLEALLENLSETVSQLDDVRATLAPDADEVVAGETLRVETTLTNSGSTTVSSAEHTLTAPDGWTVEAVDPTTAKRLAAGAAFTTRWDVTPPLSSEPGEADLRSSSSYRLKGNAAVVQPRTAPVTVRAPAEVTDVELATPLRGGVATPAVVTVVNHRSTEAVEVRVEVAVPQGWTAEPATVTVPPSSSTTVAVPVTAPGGVPEEGAMAEHTLTATGKATGMAVGGAPAVDTVVVPDGAAAVLALDGGSATGPVLDGYSRLAPGDAWDPATGYGWTTTTQTFRDRGAPDALRRDFALSRAPATLRVRLPAGEHVVSLLRGDNSFSSGHTVVKEGDQVLVPAGPNLPSGSYAWEQFTLDGGADGRDVDLQLSNTGGSFWRLVALVVQQP